jgi:hypothetical protein
MLKIAVFAFAALILAESIAPAFAQNGGCPTGTRYMCDTNNVCKCRY